MKKVVFASLVLMSSLTGFSQTENDENKKRVKFGFNFGINYSNLVVKNKLPSNATISNNIGFRLGILGAYEISKMLHLSPKAELSFNNSSYNLSNSDGSQTEYEFMPINLDFIVHMVFKKESEKLRPYLLIGPNVKIPVSKKNDDSTSLSSYWGFAFAIDVGIGIDKAFTNFNFSPELRYSFGLSNVNQNPLIPSLKFHNVSLVLNFVG